MTHPLRYRFYLPFLLLALLAPAFGAWRQVHAQGGQDLVMTVRAGFDGYCKEGQWLPIHVTVENNGPDLEARLQVAIRFAPGDEAVYGTDISLPAGARKAVFLYVRPQNYRTTLEVTLTSGKSTLLTEDIKVKQLSNSQLYGVLAADPSAYYVLNNLEPFNEKVRTAWLSLADLPDRAQGWEPLDVLLVADVDTGALSTEQRQALGLWLAGGGKLLVVGGSNWQAAVAGLQEFLPVIPGTIRQVSSLSALQEYAQVPEGLESETRLVTGDAKPGAEVLLEQEGSPLVARNKIGFGEVLYLAADPGTEPLRGWDGMAELYARLLGGPNQEPSWTRGQWEINSADNALGALAELGMPSVYLICGWLAVYALVVGPVNYFVLRRLKRRELAWVSVPLLVILFSGIAYFAGGQLRGGRAILNRLAVVQAWDRVDQAQAKALVGIYSPYRAGYTLEADENFLLSSYEGNSSGDNAWLSLQQGDTTVAPDMRVEIGGLQAAALQGYVPALSFSHDLVLTVSDGTPVLAGRVTNQSDFTLKNAYLLAGGGSVKLGNISSGESKDVHSSLPYSSSEYYDGWITAEELGLDIDYTASADEIRELNLFGTAINDRPDYSSAINPNSGIYLLGWIDQPFLEAGLQGRSFKAVNTTLYMMLLLPRIETKSGLLQLPPSLFTCQSSDKNTSPYSVGYGVSEYSLQFRPAIPIRFRTVKSLNLYLESNGSSLPLVSFWDFMGGSWAQIGNIHNGNNLIPNPGNYVSPEGEVRLKVETAPGQSNLEVSASAITLVVEP